MNITSLPEDYIFLDKIDLKNNKRQFWIVQLISFLIAIVMVAGGWFIVSLSDVLVALFNDKNVWEPIVACIVIIVGFILYIIAHEATHGLFMYAFSKTKPKFGFIGWAAYAGSQAYFNKKQYVIIAIAPLMIWGSVFALLNAFFCTGIWFWVIWFLQVCNVSGAAGDLFCAYKMTGYPAEILVIDSGTEMNVYRKKTVQEMTVAPSQNTEEQTTEENGEEN